MNAGPNCGTYPAWPFEMRPPEDGRPLRREGCKPNIDQSPALHQLSSSSTKRAQSWQRFSNLQLQVFMVAGTCVQKCCRASLAVLLVIFGPTICRTRAVCLACDTKLSHKSKPAGLKSSCSKFLICRILPRTMKHDEISSRQACVDEKMVTKPPPVSA